MIVAVIAAIIPLLLTAFEVITSDKTSVVFLENYPEFVVNGVVAYYILLIIVGLIWLILQVKSVINLRNEKVKNELLHLQSQVNPHFFFNMLNNLYGLMSTDVEKAKALVLKLSEMMRYSIYEGEKSKVTLAEEVEYLKNYIELHRMRYHKAIDIHFDISMDEGDYQIMPLLFIILLENAFKHGVENLRSGAFVSASLHAKGGIVVFEIENNFDAEQPQKAIGIGILNLRRRLELVYAGKHQLNFNVKPSIYKARLELEL